MHDNIIYLSISVLIVSRKIIMIGGVGAGDKLFQLVNPEEYAYLHEHFAIVLAPPVTEDSGELFGGEQIAIAANAVSPAASFTGVLNNLNDRNQMSNPTRGAGQYIQGSQFQQYSSTAPSSDEGLAASTIAAYHNHNQNNGMNLYGDASAVGGEYHRNGPPVGNSNLSHSHSLGMGNTMQGNQPWHMQANVQPNMQSNMQPSMQLMQTNIQHNMQPNMQSNMQPNGYNNQAQQRLYNNKGNNVSCLLVQ